MPERREQPREALADHRRADVTDVHRLGDVRRRVVDDDGLGLGRRFDPEPIVPGEVADGPGDPVLSESDVQEPGPRDFRSVGHRAEIDPTADLGRELAGIAAEPLARGHAAVRLVIAELGVGARPDGRREVSGPDRLRCGGGEGGAEPFEDIHG